MVGMRLARGEHFSNLSLVLLRDFLFAGLGSTGLNLSLICEVDVFNLFISIGILIVKL